MAKLRFYAGCIVGGGCLIMFNVLTQSPAVFFAFLAGSVCSGILSTILMGWLMVNGHMVAFQNMIRFAEGFLRDRNIPIVLTSFIRSMNPLNESKSFVDIVQKAVDLQRFGEPNDVNRPANEHPARRGRPKRQKYRPRVHHNNVPAPVEDHPN